MELRQDYSKQQIFSALNNTKNLKLETRSLIIIYNNDYKKKIKNLADQIVNSVQILFLMNH